MYLCNYLSDKKKKRSKPIYLFKFLEFCVRNLNEYASHPGADWRIKEAILYAIGSLMDSIKERKKLK
jgi:hypothetical protein